jgi:hypothetical protein
METFPLRLAEFTHTAQLCQSDMRRIRAGLDFGIRLQAPPEGD